MMRSFPGSPLASNCTPASPRRVRIIVVTIVLNNEWAAMKDFSGSIRTSIQRQSGGQVVTARERSGGVVSQETGIAIGTLERWLADALSKPARGRAWTAGARLEAVITTASMSESGKSAWCREHGMYPGELDQWRASCITALSAPEEARASPALRQPGRTANASRSWSAICGARTRPWPRQQPCWFCQKNCLF